MQFRFVILLFLVLLFTSDKANSRVADSVCAAGLGRKSFVFHGQWATGQGGIRRQLTPPYTLTVTLGSVVAYLPFYGRIYRVPTAQELRFMSIDFTATSFTYDLKPGKRNSWILHIAPQNQADAPSLRCTVTNGCYCTLWIRSAGRDPMLYEGVIQALP
jgi:hypothetical protein